MKDFVRQGALVLSGTVAASILTYVYYALISRAVGVAQSGLFISLISVIMLAALPANVAGGVISKMSADARARGETAVLNALSLYTIIAAIPIGGLAVLGALVGSPALEMILHTADRVLLVLTAFSIAITIALVAQRAVFQGAGSFATFAASNAIEGLAKAATGIAVWVFHGGVRVSIGGYAIAVLASIAYNVAHRFGTGFETPHLPRAVVLRHLIGVALPIAAITGATFADVVLVRHYFGAYESGLYGAAALAGRVVLSVSQVVPTILMPRALAQRSLGQSSTPLLATSIALTLSILAPALLLAGVYPGAVVRVVAGSAFAQAAPLILPYVAAMSALAGATVVTAYLVALERLGFAIPVFLAACGEVVAIALDHAELLTVVHIVLIGHSIMLLCCLGDLMGSLISDERVVPRRR
jgi:O-antigen/teichoic acid export membrane protein